MSNPEREEGFYWVRERDEGDLTIMFYSKRFGWMRNGGDLIVEEWDLEWISLTRLEPPELPPIR